MTTEYVVPVEQRLGRKKGVARKIRAQGKIPAILYGPDRDRNVMLTVNPKDIVEAIKKHGESVLLRLEPQGRFDNGFLGALAIIKELQRDPITYRIIHADFLEISEERAVEVDVALRFVGKPKGLRSGGVLHYVKEEIAINVLPRQIPDFIEVDISHLDIGDDIKAKDIA
ncbi:MAG TPA: 50S ribosomal protein L25, partial [Proteobacteria bacterium]|nr:50S ribosomal protein L25 [Pseudomonadota bacterium]